MNAEKPTPYPSFPGGVGISRLSVYPWESADGEQGGSPHMHLACSECYIVVSGRGRLETLTLTEHAVTPLEPGDVVWFEPGTIHRAINDGDLTIIVVMQNGGLPEAGDAVMTFPSEYLAGRGIYDAQADLGATSVGADRESRARARRDLALEGFRLLVDSFESGDTEPLIAFQRAAAELVRPQIDTWREIVAVGAAAEASQSYSRLDELADLDASRLGGAQVARISSHEAAYGMCGRLNTYDVQRRAGRLG